MKHTHPYRHSCAQPKASIALENWHNSISKLQVIVEEPLTCRRGSGRQAVRPKGIGSERGHDDFKIEGGQKLTDDCLAEASST